MNFYNFKKNKAPVIELDKYRTIQFEPLKKNSAYIIKPKKNTYYHKRKKIKIISKFRFSLSIILLIVLLLSILNFMLDLSITNADDYPQSKYIIIEQGDTLWSIAKKYGPNDKDIRHTIYIIKEENNLQSDDLYPGELLSVPIYN